MNMSQSFLLAVSFGAASTLVAQSIVPGDGDACLRIAPKGAAEALAFPPSAVRLLPSKFDENLKRNRAVLMAIEPANLLWQFRVTAGLASPDETNAIRRLGGWEAPRGELRGHTCGHWLSGMATLYAATGDEAVRARAAEVVSGLHACQRALKSGFVSAWPESFIDRVIAGKGVWAPWYTQHKILAGLLDQYVHCGNREALDVARGMGDWTAARLGGLPPETLATMRKNEFGGIGESLRNLTALTGDPKYARIAAKAFYDSRVMDPLTERREALAGWHANTFIPKVLAEVRAYELDGDTNALGRAEFFWKQIAEEHLFAPGCVSDRESLFKPRTQGAHLTGYTGESCCTYNLLKLARHLFSVRPRAELADYFERAEVNHILAQQEPEAGRVTYFLPMMTGAYKLRNPENDAFWCCVGTAMESQNRFAESAYFHAGDTLWVNEFIPTELDWNGFRIRQLTGFPEEQATALEFHCAEPRHAVVLLRRPRWAENASVAFNGQEIAAPASNGYVRIERVFREGDRLTEALPMSLRLEPAPGRPDRAALFCGPVLLAGCLGTEGMKKDICSSPDYFRHDYAVPSNLVSVALGDLKALKPDPKKPLAFRTAAGINVKPLYEINGERYVVYWAR